MGVEPTTAASIASGWTGFRRAGFALRLGVSEDLAMGASNGMDAGFAMPKLRGGSEKIRNSKLEIRKKDAWLARQMLRISNFQLRIFLRQCRPALAFVRPGGEG